jgi:hypothetical protein
MTDGRSTAEKITISSFVSRRYTEQADSVVLQFTAEDAVALAPD